MAIGLLTETSRWSRSDGIVAERANKGQRPSRIGPEFRFNSVGGVSVPNAANRIISAERRHGKQLG